MKLLVVTQAVDLDDPVLGFFHRWLEKLSETHDAIEVICLYEGRHTLPENVRVHSLGKEKGRRSRAQYASLFLSSVWKLRADYDTVFVHMNQEYVLIAGWLWKLLGKKIFMWRNHTKGSFGTDVAVAFCAKVFCTAKHSYTMRFKKTVLMPVGIDTDFFSPSAERIRVPNSILSLGRLSPVKQLEVLLAAVSALRKEQSNFTVELYGDPTPVDGPYVEKLHEIVSTESLQPIVTFHAGVSNASTPQVYSSHELFVNLTQTGSMDKSIFEALACECLVVISNESLRGALDDKFFFSEGDSSSLAKTLHGVLQLSEAEKETYREAGRALVVEQHSLALLITKLTTTFSHSS